MSNAEATSNRQSPMVGGPMPAKPFATWPFCRSSESK